VHDDVNSVLPTDFERLLYAESSGMSIKLRLIAASAFAVARWRQHALRDRPAIERFQRDQLRRLVADACSTLPFYRKFSGLPFESLPIIDKTTLLANFAGMNRAGLDVDSVRSALARGQERVSDLVIGQSTGTSGNRGYYVISDEERFVWLGTILAKTLPDALWRRLRVAIAMPGLSSLYRSASTGSRITLGFFDTARGDESWTDELAAFAPDVIVAPPKVLRWLAEGGRLNAPRIFSGGEVLDPLDRAVIETATGRKVREIYMATEGLFGVGCSQGVLHLAEDVVHFEWEQPDPNSPLRSPIVTDFTRRTQALIRYRMNDLLELADEPCPCGSAFQAVRRIVGRQDDIFLMLAADGARRMVTPDVLRNAVVDSHLAIEDFRIVQTAADVIVVTLAADLPSDIDALVVARLGKRLGEMGIVARINVVRGLSVPFDSKLRRVRRACN
jgi:putative adenylate-forming enzyme